jgi:hypothetical protein
MKRILLTSCFLFVCVLAFAQNKTNTPTPAASSAVNDLKFPVNVNQIPDFLNYGGVKSSQKPSAQTLDTFISRHGMLTSDSNAFVWLNMYYDTLGASVRNYTVYFDSLHDSDPVSTVYYPYTANDTFIIDSLYTFCSHKKTSPSSVRDTVEFRILDFSGTVLWTGSASTTAPLFNNSLTGTGAVGLVRIGCGYKLPQNTPIGVSVRFKGPVAQDSFMTLITYPYKQACTPSTSSPATKASRFIDNTYMLTRIDTNAPATPAMYAQYFAPPDILFYKDCNNNSTQDTMPTYYTSSELDLRQNAEIFLLARRNGIIIGVEEGVFTSALNVYPVPTTGMVNMNIKFPSTSDVKISVSDLQGRTVYSDTQVSVSELNGSIDLSSVNKGVYVLRVATANGSAIRKIVIN